MGFYSYIKYKKCFDWAYGGRETSPGNCTMFVESDRKIVMGSDGKVFCMKLE